MNNTLTHREWRLLRLRYAIDKPKLSNSVAKESYEVIAEELGVSMQRVRQIKIDALNKLGLDREELQVDRVAVMELIAELQEPDFRRHP